QLLRQDLIGDVRNILTATKLQPNRFRLELTESLVMHNPEQAEHLLSRLKKLGVGLSLDDFGTGYSSLSYLTQFPFDTIKIDKSFLDDSTSKRSVLLRSMVNMAHELGMAVVAEGVADDRDAQELTAMGCEYGQSYLFGRPMAAEQVVTVLKSQYQTA
ncbi:EAL domain-containing protein, partial [Salmonella enterica subsp. enterica]|nr:EAL domain-containing protein [Salmonella enterica subsp. enterica]